MFLLHSIQMKNSKTFRCDLMTTRQRLTFPGPPCR